MGRLSDASEAKLRRDLARAAAVGHDVDHLETVQRGTPGTNHGTRAVCSCGWMSTPRKKIAAAAAAYWHALEVCAVLDERGRLDLVEWSAAPSSRQGRHAAVAAIREDVPQQS